MANWLRLSERQRQGEGQRDGREMGESRKKEGREKAKIRGGRGESCADCWGRALKNLKKNNCSIQMCAQWTHFMEWACTCVCAGEQVSQVNQANAYLIFIRSSIGRQLLNSHRMHTECPNDYKVNNNCYAIYPNVWNSCINSWSQSRGYVSVCVCVCVAGGANAQSIVGNEGEGLRERERETKLAHFEN